MENNSIRKTILLIEDDRNTRNGVAKLLRHRYEIVIAEDGERGINMLKKNDFDLVLTDIQMPGASGMNVLAECLKKHPEIPCILITAYGSIETAVDAIKAGAYDFISKPLEASKLELIIERALESKDLKEENSRLKQQLDEKYGIGNVIGNSTKMREILETVKQIAPARATVLILGESGTGKELIAQAIHSSSGRMGAFIPVHCAALPSTLLESELFGHERGAFTGASEQRKGRFELADGGTIFLDEIGDIDHIVQVKLLRILETKTFEKIGGVIPIQTDARIVAATNKNLTMLVKEGRFREDLFFRLNVLAIELPPLRERKEDIPLLVKNFIALYSKENKKKIEGISEDALSIISNYNWPGNIRELRNCIERMVVLSRKEILEASSIPENIVEKVMSGNALRKEISQTSLNIENNEKSLIIQALKETNGNRTLASKRLGISRRTLHRKLNMYHLE